MKMLEWVKSFVASRSRRLLYRLKIIGFNAVGKNPYDENSFRSLLWKIRRNKLLNAEEKIAKDQLEEASRVWAGVAQTFRAPPFRLAFILFASKLLNNLPRDLRNDLNATPVNDVRKKVDVLLPLASYQRERTSIALAFSALVISALAFAISVATLLVAVWTLCTTSSGC